MEYGNSTRNAHVRWISAARVQRGILENKKFNVGERPI